MRRAHAPREAHKQGGMSLVELMVAITVMMVALALAVPSFADWIRDTKIRSTAESIQNGLQMARAEAVRRNSAVRFQLTTALDNSCQLGISGPYWVVNLTASTSPAGACGKAIDDNTAPNLLQTSPIVSSLSNTTLTATQSVVAFDGLGRQTATINPTQDPATLKIDVAANGGICKADQGTVRCLRVQVSAGGDIRLCDPAHTDASDPTTCPTS